MLPQIFWEIDHNILLALQAARIPLLDAVLSFITSLGDKGFIWIVLTVLLLCRKDTRKVGILCALALLGSLLVNNIILKNLVSRMRPFDRYDDLIPLVARPMDFSFPSGHTGSSFAAAGVMYAKLPRRLGVLAIVFAALIAFSRLYVGVHYPSDVLAGLATGLMIAVFVCLAEQKLYRHKRKT